LHYLLCLIYPCTSFFLVIVIVTSLLQLLFFYDNVFTAMRAGHPITHMISQYSKPQPSNHFPVDKSPALDIRDDMKEKMNHYFQKICFMLTLNCVFFFKLWLTLNRMVTTYLGLLHSVVGKNSIYTLKGIIHFEMYVLA